MLALIDDEPLADRCLPVRSKLNRNLARTGGNKILVIDDDHMLCLGINTRLKAKDYNPCFAHDAESALSTALAEMQALIVLTARNSFTDERGCRDAGAKRFFEKPVTNLDMMTAIQQLVG